MHSTRRYQICICSVILSSLRGRRSKGKGKGIRARAHVLSRAQFPPSPFNACHAGYHPREIESFRNYEGFSIIFPKILGAI